MRTGQIESLADAREQAQADCVAAPMLGMPVPGNKENAWHILGSSLALVACGALQACRATQMGTGAITATIT
jgi:hypothetical protein